MSHPAPPVPAQLRLTLGRPVVHEAGDHDALVLVSWQWADPATPSPRVQVYANHTLIAVSHDDEPPELWLILDRQQPQVIELLPVDPAHPDAAWTPQPDSLTAYASDRLTLPTPAVGRDESWPIDTRLRVDLDGQPAAQGDLWPAGEPRSGFGGLFGIGGFGQDAAAGPGLGLGELGYGPLGRDATAWRCPLPPTTPGQHQLRLTALGRDGQPLADPQSLEPCTVTHPPRPPRDFTLNDDFTLTWTD